ncbi:GNAT family protein [Paenibacillus urinalis]|uniref:GNAT family protein n=1 Tax=Paenibacillus urinalis TaxID=521520 RepID=A0ABY7XGD9_9BACL|nr:GNAT family protein [Paenibacillus urinalis]WDI00021.1 GNAT family protein [Paenibacillus urinalis]WDI04847.1 GNAT family protein [Paenibacillus urinalis]
MLHFAFKEFGAHKVVGMCNSSNLKSIKLMEKLQMKVKGYLNKKLSGIVSGMTSIFIRFWIVNGKTYRS